MASRKTVLLKIQDQEVPMDVCLGRRYSIRVSLGKHGLILRVPDSMNSPELVKEQIRWAEDWADKHFRKHPEQLSAYVQKTYRPGHSLVVCGQTYFLDVETHDDERNTVTARENRIRVRLSATLHPAEHTGIVRNLVSRVMARAFQKSFAARVHSWNNRYFGRPIGHIRFKYNHSNWGSCSADGNLNFSTRLLLAPLEVIDYVIVHELAHLIELNHSDRFWQLVEQVMPNYRTHEKWLKENSSRCDF